MKLQLNRYFPKRNFVVIKSMFYSKRVSRGPQFSLKKAEWKKF